MVAQISILVRHFSSFEFVAYYTYWYIMYSGFIPIIMMLYSLFCRRIFSTAFIKSGLSGSLLHSVQKSTVSNLKLISKAHHDLVLNMITISNNVTNC